MKGPARILEQLLVLQSQHGNQQALAQLVDRWNGRLLRFAYRTVGSRQAAEDIVQESWIAIVRGLRRLDDPACFRRWAYRIVRNKSVDWIRTRQRLRPKPLVQEPAATSDDAAAAKQDTITRLRVAIRQLPDDQRMAVEMFYLEAMSIAEIATVLTIPPGTVKSRLFHAREKLKKLFERRE